MCHIMSTAAGILYNQIVSFTNIKSRDQRHGKGSITIVAFTSGMFLIVFYATGQFILKK